ncbi:MAG: MIP family channel protein [Streptosporangiaceae bacterium]|nr:MIP family channel protein [Streptosporangiaceae bacterium]
MAEITPLRGEGRTVGRISGLWGECLAEFFGTFVLIVFGDGVVAMAVAALPSSGRTATPITIFVGAGDWLLIAFGWAFAVAMGIWVAGGVSGAHINPAVTLALAVRRKFPWRSVGPYMIAQVIGAFVAAALVFLLFHNAIDAFNLAAKTPKSSGQALATYSIFATFPAKYFAGSNWFPLIDEIVLTAFLLIFVVAITDDRNLLPGSNLVPLAIGFAVFAIGASLGANTGYGINPARDFGPRLFAYFAGWGKVALPGSYSAPGFHFTGYFWIPIVGPFIGGIIGVLLYDFFIGDVLHARLKQQTGGVPEPVPVGEAGPERPTGEVI